MLVIKQGPGTGQMKRALRRRGRDVFVMAVSCALVALLVAYVVSPTTYRVRFDILEHELAVRRAPAADSSVVYGVVSDEAGGIEDAEIRLTEKGGGAGHVARSSRSAADGTFRMTVPAGRYVFRVTCERDGHQATGKTSLDVEADRAYEVRVVVSEDRVFTIFPVSGY